MSKTTKIKQEAEQIHRDFISKNISIRDYSSLSEIVLDIENGEPFVFTRFKAASGSIDQFMRILFSYVFPAVIFLAGSIIGLLIFLAADDMDLSSKLIVTGFLASFFIASLFIPKFFVVTPKKAWLVLTPQGLHYHQRKDDKTFTWDMVKIVSCHKKEHVRTRTDLKRVVSTQYYITLEIIEFGELTIRTSNFYTTLSLRSKELQQSIALQKYFIHPANLTSFIIKWYYQLTTLASKAPLLSTNERLESSFFEGVEPELEQKVRKKIEGFYKQEQKCELKILPLSSISNGFYVINSAEGHDKRMKSFRLRSYKEVFDFSELVFDRKGFVIKYQNQEEFIPWKMVRDVFVFNMTHYQHTYKREVPVFVTEIHIEGREPLLISTEFLHLIDNYEIRVEVAYLPLVFHQLATV